MNTPSPSGLSNGQTPTPNGGQPQYVRMPRPADPFGERRRKKPVKRLAPGAPVPKLNGSAPASGRPPVNPRPNGVGPPRGSTTTNGAATRPTPGGWTNTPPQGTYQDFPLVTTKRALREGLRYHIARFSANKAVDPADQQQFTRPVVLHRKDPRGGSGVNVDEDGDVAMDPLEESKDREKAEMLRAEKEAQRAADLAQMAPTASNAAGAAKRGFGKKPPKTEQFHKTDKSEADKRKSDLRYEEALSWHLEDADGKNSWFGTYESALSNVNVALVVDGGSFKMIPIDKWYKFTAKAPFKTLTIEEAEQRLSKGARETRWALQTQKQAKEERETMESRKYMVGGGVARGLFMMKGESETSKNSGKRELEDGDDLDFEADDLFQDDDEQATVEPDQDEEAKEAKERIKRDQLNANIFDQLMENEVDKEFEAQLKAEKEAKLLAKEVTKALKKREKNYIYESDKSDNEYGQASSDDDTSDDEKQAEIDKRKDEEAKMKAKLEAKNPSGASTKGTSTPSGRPKHFDPSKKGKSLKRPGSPNLSESSGNESTRKKPKKMHTSSQAAMSEGEATGGEMSDGTKRKKKRKFPLGGTPAGSRAGSPGAGRAGSIGAGSRAGSRGGSPTADSPAAPLPPTRPIQPHEIAAALPDSGITIGALMGLFTGRVGNDPLQQSNKTEFIKMVKDVAAYSPDKLLRPKKAETPAA